MTTGEGADSPSERCGERHVPKQRRLETSSSRQTPGSTLWP